MGRYVQHMLLPDEYIIYATGLHWIVYRYGFFLLLAGGFLGYFAEPAVVALYGPAAAGWMSLPLKLFGALLLLSGAIQLFFALLRRVSTEIVVTNQRVIAKKGVIAVRVYETMIKKVTSVNIEHTVMGRIQGYGDVTILASGGDLPEIDDVDNPLKLYHYVMGTSRAEQRAELKELGAFEPPALEEPPRFRSISGGKREG